MSIVLFYRGDYSGQTGSSHERIMACMQEFHDKIS
jgi:hypothetical protein